MAADAGATADAQRGAVRDLVVAGRRVRLIDRPGSDPTAIPLLFVHGASGNGREPHFAFADRLTRHRALFVDRPGQGATERFGRGDAAPDAQAAVMAGVLEAAGVERAIVVGHSWGGSVAAALAVTRPDRVAGLAFLAPATHPWPGGVDFVYRVAAAPWIGRAFCTLVVPIAGRLMMAGAVRGVFAPDPVPTGYAAGIGADLVLRPAAFRANAEDVADLHGHVTRLAPRYPEISAPTVVITGSRDPIVLNDIHAAGLVRDIAGARLVELEGRGHMPHHAATERVAAEIAALAARVEAG